VDRILDDIIRREGGFVDRADDRGGPTNFGITMRTLSTWLGREATREDVARLSEMQARSIYEELYIKLPGFDRIANPVLRRLLVDSGIQHGPERAIRWLQHAVHVGEDGKLGPVTLAAVNHINEGATYMSVLGQRIRFYGHIVNKDHSQAVFIEGWLNRVTEFLEVI